MPSKEIEWLSNHPEIEEKYVGEYVGIVENRIVAHGKNFKEVLEIAQKAGEVPFIHKVLPSDKELVV